jgi:hypothetical protein
MASLGKNKTKFNLPGQNPNLVFADGLDLVSKEEKSKVKRQVFSLAQSFKQNQM